MEPETSSIAARSGTSPALSVVMPVRNALPYLDEAVESILSQTFDHFEFVILDDASTDGSAERLRHWAELDSRIRLLTAERTLGPVQSSNMVAREARAPFVARMDADDISYPARLAEQMDLFRKYPQAGVVAALGDLIDADGRKLRGPEVWRLTRRSPMVPFAHGAMMYRRELFDTVGGYRRECEYWEDQDLITRMAAVSEILVIPNALYCVRQTSTSTRVLSHQERMEEAIGRMYRSIAQSDDLPGAADGKLNPRVFISIGSPVLWAGGRPRLFWRMIAGANLGANVGTVSSMAWTAWASANPTSLRIFLKALLRLRNFAARSIARERAVRWAPAHRHHRS